ncbi:aminotransferase class I/II-fold pyridoxal phosphate-dependent enzyme [Amycolatopsis minnesotensis]|uniref:Histidinol-phosphate transaminase n=1 Tax=Amycolatopsis minnesotensis TaxID=337894 RepID=A0ABP5CHZ6_9PSEU
MTTEATSARYARPRETGGPTRLAGNELPYEPPAPVLAAIHGDEAVNRYPDPAYTALTSALAEHLGTPAEHIVLGAGSSSVFQRLFRVACAEPGGAVMWTAPTYDAFDLFARQAGALAQRIAPTSDGAVDLGAMLAASTADTRMIILVNPHNPTGAVLRGSDLRAFLDEVDEGITVVVDEAYREFCTDTDIADGLAVAKARWAAGRHDVAVVRTFSKAYGLAGMRVGYCVAPVPLAQRVRDEGVPREVTFHAAATAVAALEAQAEMRENVSRIVAERTRVLAELRRIGFAPGDSQSNYVWLPLAGNADRFAAHCADDDVVVLAIAGHGVRVSIGSEADNDRLLHAARAWATVGN